MSVGDWRVELQPKLCAPCSERTYERGVARGPKALTYGWWRRLTVTKRDDDRRDNSRSDLLLSLNVFPIRIPPLRERPEDIHCW